MIENDKDGAAATIEYLTRDRFEEWTSERNVGSGEDDADSSTTGNGEYTQPVPLVTHDNTLYTGVAEEFGDVR